MSYPQETLRAAQAFRDYCLLGASRSLRKLKEHYQHAPNVSPICCRLESLKDWSSRYHWQERVREYDKAQAAIEQAAQNDAIAAMNAQQLQMATDLQERIYARFIEQLDAGIVPPSVLIAGLKWAVDLQRKALGMDDRQRVELTSAANQEPITFNFNTVIDEITAATKSA